jgi:hypothetical protein
MFVRILNSSVMFCYELSLVGCLISGAPAVSDRIIPD